MTDLLNRSGAHFADWMGPMVLQVGFLVLLIAVLDVVLRRRAWPRLRMALWLLVAVRLVLPPTLVSPWSVTAPVVARSLPGSGSPVFPVDRALTPEAWILVAWMAVVIALAVFSVLRHRHQVARLLAGAAAPSSSLLAVAERAARRVGLSRVPEVLLSPRSGGAAVLGSLRPVVVLPVEAEGWSPSEAEHILLHEFAHVRRGDPVTRAVLESLRLLHWFHPLVWLAVRRMDALRELCCDATVSAVLQGETREYRGTLLRTAARSLLGRRTAEPLPALAWLGGGDGIIDRLHWLERPANGNGQGQRALVLLSVAALLVFVVPMGVVPQAGAAAVDVVSAATAGGRVKAYEDASLQRAREVMAEYADPETRKPGCMGARLAAMRLLAEQQSANEGAGAVSGNHEQSD
ncbi:MAG: M56 family metallopeptidase [Planctomycetota bacterium]|jgi:beta-lactamase regulating signal transducer with metallopeptidase domain